MANFGLKSRLSLTAALCLALVFAWSDARASLKVAFEQEIIAPTPESVLRELVRDKHIVLVGGFMTEFYQQVYFSEAKEYLGRILPQGQLDLVFPDWKTNAEVNAGWLREKLIALRARQAALGMPKPLWVIGHSKGGQEVVQLALQTAVEKPDLLSSGALEKLVAIQATVGGSPLAQVGEIGCAILKSQLAQLALPGGAPSAEQICASLQVLDPEVAAAAIQRWTARLSASELAPNRELVNRALHFVRASHWEKTQEKLYGAKSDNLYSKVLARDWVSPFLRKPYELLRLACGSLLGLGSNDGLVCLKDQVLEGWGTDLTSDMPLDNDHADLAVAYPFGNAGEEFQAVGSSIAAGKLYREAFLRALIRALSAN